MSPDAARSLSPHSNPEPNANGVLGASRTRTIASWVGAVLVAGLMTAPVGALPKLTGDGFAQDLFRQAAPVEGLADPMRLFTGVVELIIAVLVLVPKTRAIGAVAATVVLLGAIGTHLFTPLGVVPTLTHVETGEQTETPLFFFALVGVPIAAGLAWLERRRLPLGPLRRERSSDNAAGATASV